MSALSKSILEFWFKEESKTKWFDKSDEFDAQIKSKFFEFYNIIKEKPLEELTKSKDSQEILSYIILLDQFSRNIFRGSKESFKTDEKALNLSKFIIKNNLHKDLEIDQIKFIYIPFMHSENLEDQKLCVKLFEELNENYSLDYAIKHKVIIEKFVRFPHRNNILGRKSTKEEIEFLKQPDSSF